MPGSTRRVVTAGRDLRNCRVEERHLVAFIPRRPVVRIHPLQPTVLCLPPRVAGDRHTFSRRPHESRAENTRQGSPPADHHATGLSALAATNRGSQGREAHVRSRPTSLWANQARRTRRPAGGEPVIVLLLFLLVGLLLWCIPGMPPKVSE